MSYMRPLTDEELLTKVPEERHHRDCEYGREELHCSCEALELAAERDHWKAQRDAERDNFNSVVDAKTQVVKELEQAEAKVERLRAALRGFLGHGPAASMGFRAAVEVLKSTLLRHGIDPATLEER